MTGYSYDAAGNLMLDPQSGITYTYDDENRVISGVLSGATVAQYWYDAEGQRIRKVSAAGTEEYVYDSDGHQVGEMTPNGTFNRSEIYAGERHLATYDLVPAQTIFIHDDWQGTERVRSRYDGTPYETCTNLPYGDQQNCVIPSGNNDPSPLHYTGKMRDAETTLDYFGAHYYSSGMGHWMSPDWADKPTAVPYANFGDPQSLNLYAMVAGNPVSHQDDDGHYMSFQQYLSSGWSTGGADPSPGGAMPSQSVASMFQAPTTHAAAPATTPATTTPTPADAPAAAPAATQKRIGCATPIDQFSNPRPAGKRFFLGKRTRTLI